MSVTFHDTESSTPSDISKREPYAQVIVQEWNTFVRHGSKPSHVDEPIFKSWLRSKALDVNPYCGKSQIILSPSELQETLNKNQGLVQTAKSYMHKIYDAVKGMKHLLYLTDVEGNILYLVGGAPQTQRFEQHFNFKVGASWSEQAVGTTAVAVALHESTTIPYMSSAKYCYNLKVTSCAAIPLRNSEEEVVGILGIAAHSKQLSQQIFWMLVSAQMGIENQFRLQRYEDTIQVISQQYQSVFDSVSDVIVCVDNLGRISDINAKAEEILNTNVRKIRGKYVGDVLDFSPLLLRNGGIGNTRPKGFLYDTRRRMYPLRKQIHRTNSAGESDGQVYVFDGQHTSSARRPLKAKPPSYFCFDDIIGQSPVFLDVKEQAITAAGSCANVLLTGESGTGKEMFAQAIHAASDRTEHPFVAINCGAIPKELIESEFFGYERGAFTGADKKGKAGKFEQANGGTLFLDEIGEMPHDLQIRLLRVLQNRRVIRIGGTRPIDVDVRIIAATNKDILHEVTMKTFRSDLFWRLNVIDLRLPSLLERRDDIQRLVEFFLRKHAPSPGKDYRVDESVWALFMHYPWPGNVRELENTVERALIFARDATISIEALPHHIKHFHHAGTGLQSHQSLEETEKCHIEEVLHESHYNISQTARVLGVARNTLYKKISKYHIRCSDM
ncbi:hypothetical protein CSA56_02330 [candidate division KSB3 bacterium]|uniref:Sigma-54-dependent Fis family transcriptional regulator n=1 Tax=candidate division KSB3 bacterium TaxID=2044937 RepID=A0A2G6KKJ0_9BACT|nr:MAG: hypothetical protein CSA56_02330 [candidate division KSB3 bacterium]